MGVKVYFAYEGEGPADGPAIVSQRLNRPEYKPKITLPDAWLEGPAEKLLAYFCKTYSGKFPDTPLDPSEVFLRVGSVDVPPTAVASQFVQAYNDVLVLHKLQPTCDAAAAPAGSRMCGNFGCGKRFVDEENGPTACHHHARGPVFHDTYKYWGCCPDQKALDWEDFEAIPKCAVGPHAVVDRNVTFKSPNAIENQALSAEQVSAMYAQQQQSASATAAAASHDGKPRTGPREFEEGRATDEPGPIAEDGTAKCRNYGCGQRFVVADNGDAACRYHAAGPVFWDTYKYWKCCPDRKHSDFDDFAKVEGCTTGPHRR